jgi:hypothetical protein
MNRGFLQQLTSLLLFLGLAASPTGCHDARGKEGDPCSAEEPCEDGVACVFQAGSCKEGAKGVCSEIIQCDGPPTGPDCGCDGKTIERPYGACDIPGPLDTPAACQVGTFACGPSLQCKRNSDVCIEKTSGKPASTVYSCAALDSGEITSSCLGGIPDCACLQQDANTKCTADADHQETLSIVSP